MRLQSLTPRIYYYRPAVKATLNQIKETGAIITRFVNRGKTENINYAGEKLLNMPVTCLKKCWFSDDFKLNSQGKEWMTDLLDSFDLSPKASLSDLVISAIEHFKK